MNSTQLATLSVMRQQDKLVSHSIGYSCRFNRVQSLIVPYLMTGFLSLVVVLSGPNLRADTYWVSPEGEADWRRASGTRPLARKTAASLAAACEKAKAGDTVYLRGGNYQQQTITPINSGKSEQDRIVFSNYKDETVRFEDSPGIQIRNKSYITVTGMEFHRMVEFFRIYGSSHIEISHCLFDGRSERSGAWAGAAIGVAPQDRSRKPSTHNRIRHCQFYRFVYKGNLPNRGALLDIGNLNNGNGENGSTHNLIEHNILAYGGHHTFGVYSRYNVIRYNYTHNETNPGNWDFPGYRGAVTQGTSGGYCLYEGNRFGWCDQAGIGVRSPRNLFRSNLLYHNGQGGMQVVTNAVGKDRADQNYIYHNTFFKNGHRVEYPGFQGGMYFANWKGASPQKNVVKNNLFYDNKNGSISFDGPVDEQVIDGNWDNNSRDPRFVDDAAHGPGSANKPDLRIVPNSPAKDRAQWLTTVTSYRGRSKTLKVHDSRYFMNGWGIIEGDKIQLEGKNETATIVEIDYNSHTITVDRVLDYSNGMGVGLAYEGSAPDIGAYEVRRN